MNRFLPACWAVSPTGEVSLARALRSSLGFSLACLLSFATVVLLPLTGSAEPSQAGQFIDSGDQWIKKGDYDRAVADYSEAVRLDERNARAFNNRGFAWHRAGHHDKALADFDKALRLQPGYVQALNNRGGVLLEMSRHKEAVADFTQVLKLNPLEVAALLGRASALKAINATNEAQADVAAVRDILQKNRVGGGLMGLAQALETSGHHGAALEACTQALERGDLSAADKAQAYYLRGSVRGYLGNSASAIDDFSKAIELAPGLGNAYCLRGYLRGTLGQYAAAENDYAAALGLARDQAWKGYLPWVLGNYADLWRRRGELNKALSFCDQALKAGDSPGANLQRAWTYLDMGRTAQAKAELEIFESEMERQGVPFHVMWPEERAAISRLRKLR